MNKFNENLEKHILKPTENLSAEEIDMGINPTYMVYYLVERFGFDCIESTLNSIRVSNSEYKVYYSIPTSGKSSFNFNELPTYETNYEISSTTIPFRLKEKFIKDIGLNVVLTTENDINEFLKNNK